MWLLVELPALKPPGHDPIIYILTLTISLIEIWKNTEEL